MAVPVHNINKSNLVILGGYNVIGGSRELDREKFWKRQIGQIGIHLCDSTTFQIWLNFLHFR